MQFDFDFKNISEKIIESQGLEGLLFALSPQNLNGKLQDKFKNKWIEQYQNNQLFWSELRDIDQLLSDISIRPILLKGMSFFGRLYKDFGRRKISDIDIYLNPKDALHFIQLVQRRGFVQIDEKGPTQKIILSKVINDKTINLEIHTKLFAHIEKTFDYNGINIDGLENFKCLPLEEEFVYLCYHLARQHTFLKLQWTIDLVLFLQKYPQLNFDKVMDLSAEYQNKKSVLMALWLLHKFFKIEIPNKELEQKVSSLNFPIDREFLLSPRQNKLKEMWVRLNTQEYLSDSIKYKFTQFKNKIVN